MDEAERVRERARVQQYEPPVFGLEEDLWVAEDDETDCVGVGRVRAEALGNLVAVVERHGHDEGSHVKLPGAIHARTWEDDDGLLARLRDRLL